mgnify:CR=1 FL=1
MKLESVHLKNFRAFKELKLDFHPNLNVIAGINGAGKTTILDICSIFMSHIISQIEKGTSQRAIKINELDIFNKSNETSASAKFKDDFIKNDVNNFIVLNQTRIGFGKSKNNEIDALKNEQSKKVVQEANIHEEKLTRKLMEKDIKSIIVRGNQILKIEWK